MFLRSTALITLLVWSQSSVRADVFREAIAPFAEKYCVSCHNAKQARGEWDVTRYRGDADVVKDFRRWNHVIEFLRNGEMPPDDKPQPALEERNAAVAAIEKILLVEARKNAGDPGLVLPRRLSNTEFDLSVRDLTGVGIRATVEFPVDPAGGEGFDNTGEALSMSPSLLNKYLGAADFVAKHLVLTPRGIAFSEFPAVSYNERKKFTEQALIDFYRRHDVKVSDYLLAAWRYRHRPAADRALTLGEWAARHNLSPKYLTLLATTLEEAKSTAGYLKLLGMKWEALPAPATAADVPVEFKDFERLVSFVQSRWNNKEPQLIVANASNWPIGHVALRTKVAENRDRFPNDAIKGKVLLRFGVFSLKRGEKPQETTLHLRVDPAFPDEPGGVVILRRPILTKSFDVPRNKRDADETATESLREFLERMAPDVARRLNFGKHPGGAEIDADSLALKAPAAIEIPLTKESVAALQGKRLLVACELDPDVPADAAVHVQYATGTFPAEALGPTTELIVRPESGLAQRLTAAGERFSAAFPNRFAYVDKERGLAAGFHLVEGLFRDDRPLRDRVLNDADREELDRLWRDLDFVTESAEKLLRGFVWFERAERHVLHDKRFDFLRSEDPQLVEEELLSKFERLYIERLGIKLVEGELRPLKENEADRFNMIHGFFDDIRAKLAEHKRMTQGAEKPALADLERLARRAYGRDLTPAEVASLRGLYQKLRKQGLDVEDSLRGTFTAILMSPHFFYRIPPAPAGCEPQPLAELALARRLSYFLWSSLPDDELLDVASKGRLQDPAVLRAQVRRMMRDPKVTAFAREFFGQWLRYRDYLSKDTIPADAFAGYDEALRQAMFEEPTRLITHLIREDQSVDELLHGNATFVNERLAIHYGGAIEEQYRRLTGLRDDPKRRKADPNAVTEWRRVEGLRDQGRGGLFGMPVILAKNSAGQRTSPVKRGFWVVHHLLGQHFPPPPADIPELPKSEKESPKTIREMVSQHTADRRCAMCHAHFDGLGLTLEGFDAIGHARTKDTAGRPVEVAGPLPGGKTADGIGGLINYVEKQRLRDFERNLCRKLLGYALGRSVTLSDHALLEDMEKYLQADRRFSVLFETIVLSPQFRQQRGAEVTAARP